MVRVTYHAGEFLLGESSDRASDFALRYVFTSFGARTIEARGLDAQGREVDSDTIRITIDTSSSDQEFTSPLPGGAYRPAMWLKVTSENPEIKRVRYVASGVTLGESSDEAGGFAVRYTFQSYGERELTAEGLDAQGRKLAERTITVTVTDAQGRVPSGSSSGGSSGGSGSGSGSSGSGTAPINSSMASRLASEAGKCSASRTNPAYGQRCQNGSGGWSTGECWGYVWGAMVRSGLTTQGRADQLAAAGPCSAGEFNRSAYGMRCNANTNPATLARSMGLRRVNIPATQAPRGAVIAWDRGFMGYNYVHGHIEISHGNGMACSDFCGRIRGNATCASVYVPSP